MPADPTDFSLEVSDSIVIEPDAALRPVDAVTTQCQYQEMFRIQNRSSAVVDDIIVRQYLPVNSAVQSLDWSVLADVDPRVLAAEVREWHSQGARNRYVNWRIGPLEPEDVVQVGVVCGVTFWEPAEPSSHGPAAGLHHPRAMVPPSNADLAELKNLSSLCQFIPIGADGAYEGAAEELWPAWVPPGAEATDGWDAWTSEEDGVVDLSSQLSADWWADARAALAATLTLDPWAPLSDARLTARLIGSIINAQEYPGSQDDADDATGFMSLIVPGSSRWPRLLQQALGTASRLLGLLQSAGSASTSPSALTSMALSAQTDFLSESDTTDAVQSTCSERGFQMLWLFRLAGIPARELGGHRLGKQGTTGRQSLPVGAAVGHRMIEVWDAQLGGWFVVDTTSTDMGPAIRTLDFLTKVRGTTSQFAPLIWGYETEVFRGDVGGAVASVLHDDSPEGPGVDPWEPRFAGPLYYLDREYYGEEVQETTLQDALHNKRLKSIIRGGRATYAEAADRRDFVAAEIAATSSSNRLGWCALSRLRSGPLALPPATNDSVALSQLFTAPTPASVPFCAQILVLAGPQIVVEDDGWFTQTYLTLPEPWQAAPEQVTYTRLIDGAPPVSQGPSGPSQGTLFFPASSRSPWAWGLVAGRFYFGGWYGNTSGPAGNPGWVQPVSDVDLAAWFMPPLPVVHPLFAPLVSQLYLQRMLGWLEMVHDLAEAPVRVLSRIVPYASPGRATINAFGDLIVVPTGDA